MSESECDFVRILRFFFQLPCDHSVRRFDFDGEKKGRSRRALVRDYSSCWLVGAPSRLAAGRAVCPCVSVCPSVQGLSSDIGTRRAEQNEPAVEHHPSVQDLPTPTPIAAAVTDDHDTVVYYDRSKFGQIVQPCGTRRSLICR